MEADLIAAAEAIGQPTDHPKVDPDILAAAEAISQPLHSKGVADKITADEPNQRKTARAVRATRPQVSEGMSQLANYASSSDDDSSSEEAAEAPAEAPELESV